MRLEANCAWKDLVSADAGVAADTARSSRGVILADAWAALTVINAVTRSGGEGGVFWSAVA
jgi:hypothetical protein